MKYDMIMLRFGELALKGKNRGKFEKAIERDVRRVLRPFPGLKYMRTFGRLYIELEGESYEKVAVPLHKVFGIVSYSPLKRTESTLDAIRATSVAMMKELKQIPATFKVATKRPWKQFPHDTLQMNHLVGGYVLQAFPGLKVDVHQPEVTLHLDIQENASYVFCEVVPAAGGFPLGTNGKAMLMLSGGIDSPVAGWLAMKRGLELEAVHFHSYPFTSERAQQKVIELTEVLSQYAGRIKLHMVPFTEIQTELNKTGQQNLLITLMRRIMLKITVKLAERNKALAIVTGDSLGQVASQTLGSLNVIGKGIDIPLLRPLIAMDKVEIVKIAESIGTYPISILPYEDCCTLFVPKSPSTNPNLHVVERTEQSLAELDRWIEDAVNQTETIVLPNNRNEIDRHLF